MLERARRVRQIAVLTVAAVSVVVALGAAFYAITPAAISTITTWALGGVFGLLILPGVTIGAWELDRRAIRNGRPGAAPPAPHAEHRHTPSGRAGEARPDAHRHRVRAPSPHSRGG